MEEIIEDKTKEISAALSRLKRKLKTGDESELVHWVITDRLACSQRPLRYHPRYGGSGRNIPREATDLVHDWVFFLMQCEGIKSIICLMHTRDLECYADLELSAPDLIAFYRHKGFEVAHLPWEDPQHSGTSRDQIRKKLREVREKALGEYGRLTKPVLIQCSAGMTEQRQWPHTSSQTGLADRC